MRKQINWSKLQRVILPTLAATTCAILVGCSEKPEQSIKDPDSGAQSMNLQDASANTWRMQMIATANTLKNQIGTRYPVLQQERDRSGKITAELTNQTATGCFADVPMQKLEILIKGSWLPRMGVGNSSNPMSSQSTGNPTTVTFQFGEHLAVVNDEQTSAMFQPAGRKVVTELGDFKLGDIEYIRIAKGGAAYDSERVCRASGFLGTSEKCEYQNYEESRLGLDSIELKINGETFYRRDAIGKQLQGQGTSLEWRDDQLKINEAWLNLMVRQDCPQGIK